MPTLTPHRWQRDPRNPIFPPGNEGSGGFDVACCMNPFVLRRGDEYWLYYAGADKHDKRRVCLAIAPVNDLSNWRRLGPLFELGGPNAFDGDWCVLPCIHRFGDTWHLYYTGFNASLGKGLQAFRGIGLATSNDLLNWTKHPASAAGEPVLTGGGFTQWPSNFGLAGAGNIVAAPTREQPNRVRMHYTLSTGSPDAGDDLRVKQAKQSVCAHSTDGIAWTDKRVLLTPRADCDYENAATIGLTVWRTSKQFRAIYSAIGTRFGMYSICEAVSDDGLIWQRGEPDENLSLAPTGDGWEREMVEYPCVVPEGDRLRLFYCGNQFGETGIGTALAERVD